MDQLEEIERIICAVEQLESPEAIASEKRNVVDRLAEYCQKDCEAYPLYALTASCDDWDSFEIVRPDIFRSILLEGIGKGCLNPEADYAWEILSLAAAKNDPATFMDDLEEFYHILATATENGNYTALDIMDQIWEPEQIIEED